MERYICRNPAVSIQSKIDMLNQRLMNKVEEQLLGKELRYTEAERKAIRKAYRRWYGGTDHPPWRTGDRTAGSRQGQPDPGICPYPEFLAGKGIYHHGSGMPGPEKRRPVDLITDELCLHLDQSSGAIQYLTKDNKPLRAERVRECRQLETASGGRIRAWLFLSWFKREHLYSPDTEGKENLELNGAARYISHRDPAAGLPLVISDKGYGILMASGSPTHRIRIT